MTKPFRFGVAIAGAESGEALKAMARRAETLGYNILLVPDHHYAPAPFTMLATLAAATSTIRIGSQVFGNDFRNPVHLAREMAVLDQLSGGRVQIGLGTGYIPVDYLQLGVSQVDPKVQVGRFEESLALLKQYFTREEVNFSGKYYSVTGLKGSTVHLQKPHPPFYLGASRTGKRMARIAAREADVIGLNNGTTEDIRERVKRLQEAAPERFEGLELATAVFVVAITPAREIVAQSIAANLQGRGRDTVALTPEQVLDSVQYLAGTEDQIVETLQERREQLGISYIQVMAGDIEKFAPIVARLAGK
jgi:probable F420-dependent oxidoreductase